MADDILKNIPLPADLPENWTSGQIIAPTGAEAGLDEQHGYNYLMEQVNNAQKALKALAAQREEDLARIKFWASNDPTSPASFIGGTWERIEGKFVMGASDSYPAGSTGGEEKHTLTESELPNVTGNVEFQSDGNHQGIVNGVGGVFAMGQMALGAFQPNNRVSDEGTARQFRMSFGSNLPHNNIPPYYSVYIWRRVA